MKTLLEVWKERLERFQNHPEIAKGVDSILAMGIQKGRVTALKECIQELEELNKK